MFASSNSSASKDATSEPLGFKNCMTIAVYSSAASRASSNSRASKDARYCSVARKMAGQTRCEIKPHQY